MSRNSITPSRAFLTCGVSVRITMPSAAGIAQDAMGLGERSHLHQAHAAVAGDGEPVVVAEVRDLLAGLHAGLHHG